MLIFHLSSRRAGVSRFAAAGFEMLPIVGGAIG